MVRLALLTATLLLLKGTSSVAGAAYPRMEKESRAPADGHNLLVDTFSTYDAPNAVFPAISHPFLPVYADSHDSDPKKNTVPTNAWHSNLFYPSAENLAPTITDPYILRFLDGYGGNPGLSIHQSADRVYGEYPAVNDVPPTQAGYMINSVVVDLRLTCTEWANVRPDLKVTSWDALTANVRLASPSSESHIDFPLARGMAYVTALYQGLTPNVFTQHAIVEVTADGQSTQDTFTGHRFRLKMNDPQSSVYLIYALGNQPLTLTRSGFSNLVASAPYDGPIRIAKVPGGESQAEEVLDRSRGVWATAGQVTASSSTSNAATYTLQWQTSGSQSQPLLNYAYAHHLHTLDDATRSTSTGVILDSSTKGPMTAVLGSQWTLNEPELLDVNWLPPNPKVPETAVVNEIMSALEKDVASNYTNATMLEDNYFSGKGLQKFAMVALVLNRPDETGLRNPELAETALSQLKKAFLPYLRNTQEDPFSYDNVYRGVVARSGLPQEMGGTGDVNAGFGHSYYSDHHYHHGYFIVTAAIIHYLDPEWMTDDIKSWTEVMIRDVNAPEEDPYFAPFRNWDWFAGHSWAGGIKVNGALDGRDQESIPEAINFYYGMRLWALATQNEALRDLASLQLTIMKRTTYEYFWMLDNNQNRPEAMIKNKVVGIFFEHKIDYTTYFGRYLEFIHGIQQLPMTPALAAIRTPEFVAEEWDHKLAAVAPTVRSSWAGVLYLNYALIDSTNAYAKLRKVTMDDGQTRSYSMYLAATQPQFRKKVKSAHASPTSPNSTDRGIHKASVDGSSLLPNMRIFRPFQRHQSNR